MLVTINFISRNYSSYKKYLQAILRSVTVSYIQWCILSMVVGTTGHNSCN